jgi:hypothetical protein
MCLQIIGIGILGDEKGHQGSFHISKSRQTK